MPRQLKPKGAQQLRDLRKLKAIIEHKTLKDAYKSLHPNASDATAKVNGSKMLTEAIFEDVKRLMGLEAVVKADKEILEKVLFLVVSRWMGGGEKTIDMIAAIRELTKLVPEFKDKLQVEDITNASEEELDRKLRSFGYDPSVITNPN